MGVELPLSLADLRTRVRAITDHSRQTPDAEVDQAVNYGYRKAIRAIGSVRPQLFATWVDPFTLSAGVSEYDIGGYDPPLWRPTKMIVGAGGGQRIVRFRYRSMQDREFEEKELSAAASFQGVFYDVLEGRLPGTAVSIAIQSTTTGIATTTGLYVGQSIELTGIGPLLTYPGGATVRQQLRATIVGINFATSTITWDPAASVSTPPSQTLTPIRRRLLKIAPATSDSVTGRLYYHYRPFRLSAATDQLDVTVSEHSDMIVFYAAGQLLQAVDEPEAKSWTAQAEAMRSEMMQDLEPLGGESGEALGSDLLSVGDF